MSLYFNLCVGIIILSLLSSCSSQKKSESFSRLSQLEEIAPQAESKTYQAEYHGLTLTDDYHWLRDQDYPEVNDNPVLDYLKAENDYYAKFLTPHKSLVDTLFEEFKGRVDETDTSVPWQKNGYEYRWYFKPGNEYKTWVRRKLDSDVEQVFMDENLLAQGHEYFSLEDWDISPDNVYLAYSVDTDGSERNIIKIKNLINNEYFEDELINTTGSVQFSQDNQSLIYSLLHKDKWLPLSVNVHKLGTQQDQDNVLVSELDESFYLGFYVTSSEQYLVLTTGDSDRTEVSVASMADLNQAPEMLNTREQNFKLEVDHGNGYFYMLTNDTHLNFRIAKTQEGQLEYDQWQTVFAGSDSRYFKHIQIFKDFVAIGQSIQGLESISILPNQGASHEIALPEKVASVGLGNNPEFSQQQVRIQYESMITPDSTYDYDVSKKTLNLRKARKIPSGYDKSLYTTERIMADARDGVKVPITLVYKKGFKKDGSQPLYLYAYGGYGIGMDPSFSTTRLSLLDRGFAFAYAHVRGGDEMGYQWYLDGKLDKRTNTFNDFVDVAKHLIDEGYVAKGNISIKGGSAGGELMGAVVNQAPELWRSVTLAVPFVDVLNTMLDGTLPLTPPEWGEWGNPLVSKKIFEYIQSYSPYDNIQAKEYPPMLVTGGLNDPRVTYWEPAKWTAKMRATKTDNNLLVMRMNMGAGHFSNTGRYGRLKDSAEEYAFALIAHGIKQ
ncbi:S9 family peptidase [Paraglaciecola arctica]|uniref:Oligopeptidase B n=1 Tax=Paraglaciecola arctica BSs20135 TaxID=493475 RepID=K6YTM7_9ALTE|nr:S9 family peptidase [Paraglaciecola arctica]GAC21522.1 oligopeptidase B [Paraglaciecola arctica BSs20135]